ncbi:MAG: PAS domain-containing sensor histidine kinase, partial [Pseudomonadota bacterium]
MKTAMLSMVPIQVVDIVGSTLMIIFAFLCVRHVLTLKRQEPQNVIWTYLLWFTSGLLIFSISRSVGHLIKYLLIAAHLPHIWQHLSPVTGALNSLSFILVGAITLFFSKIYRVYGQMIEDRARLEEAHSEIIQL